MGSDAETSVAGSWSVKAELLLMECSPPGGGTVESVAGRGAQSSTQGSAQSSTGFQGFIVTRSPTGVISAEASHAAYKTVTTALHSAQCVQQSNAGHAVTITTDDRVNV